MSDTTTQAQQAGQGPSTEPARNSSPAHTSAEDRAEPRTGSEPVRSSSTAHTSTGGSSREGQGTEPGSQAEGGADEGPITFDRATASRHPYLGDNLEDLERRNTELIAGAVYHVPYFPLEGIVLCPGDTLPMRLQHPLEQQLAQRALQAAPPLNGLIAVSARWSLRTRRLVIHFGIPRCGCLAEIRQLRLQEDGSMSLISKGRHRVVFVEGPALRSGEMPLDYSHIAVRVLPDDELQGRVPRPVASLAAYWAPWAYRPFDAYYLAKKARELLGALLPKAPSFQGSPLALSYWLVSNLPMTADLRQQLLEESTSAERLRLEIELLQEMSKVSCTRCNAEIGDLQDVVQMSEGGVSGVFVNPHGVVHDILMLGKARGIRLEGEPSTESSWFPGYAWTVGYCMGCWQHLGWRFTAVEPGLKPYSFWGLRRAAVEGGPSDPEAASFEGGGSQQEGTEDDSFGEPGALVATMHDSDGGE